VESRKLLILSTSSGLFICCGTWRVASIVSANWRFKKELNNEKKSGRLCTNQWDCRQKNQRVGLGLLHCWRQIAFMSFFWNLWGVLMSQGLWKIFSMMILIMICMDIMIWQCFWHKWHVTTKATLLEWRFICMIWRWWKVYQDSRVMNEAITKTRGVGDWISSVIWRWSMYLSGR